MLSVKEPRTFNNTIMPYTLAEQEYEAVTSPLTFMANVHPSQQMRDAINQAEDLLDEYHHKSNTEEDIYKAFVAFRDNSKKTKEWDSLSHQDRMFVDKSILDSERNGIGLP